MNNKQRIENNQDILRRMKGGDSLQYNASLTWFPPRPQLKKDSKLVKELYGDNVDVVGEEKKFKINLVKE